MTGRPGLGLLRVLRPTPPVSAGNKPSRRPAGCWPVREPAEWFPRSTFQPFDRVGAQLCPCNIATATPQAFTVASRVGDINRPKSSPPSIARWVYVAARPRSARFEPLGLLRSFRSLVPRVRLSVLLAGPGPSGGASPSRRCQGCFPPSPPVPEGSGCPQLHVPAATKSDGDH